ncbi:MAG: tRNA 2-thiocytidine(32) synthetase TtcA [Clostridia bacterium]|nr:tRNA 2-thiocytidine(32) synthetase TtcA [Clostridia bacterium]
MKGLRRLLSYARRACDDYEMIKDGDRIAVGVSAGKDSLSLLCTLAELRRFYPQKFDVVAITVDMRFDEIGKPAADYKPIAELCERLDVKYHVEPSNIAKIVFDVRKESNPCSLCAKLRRGAVNDTAKKLGCNKVALGHHFDDAVETFMLNLFFEGRIGCFSPVTYLDRTDITVIRPLVYAPEKDVRYFARSAELPVIESPCPADKDSERAEMKRLIASLEKQNKGLKHRIFGAMQRANIDGYVKSRLKNYDDE